MPPFPVEELKSAAARGKYLHSTEYGYPEMFGIDYAHRHALEQEALDQ